MQRITNEYIVARPMIPGMIDWAAIPPPMPRRILTAFHTIQTVLRMVDPDKLSNSDTAKMRQILNALFLAWFWGSCGEISELGSIAWDTVFAEWDPNDHERFDALIDRCTWELTPIFRQFASEIGDVYNDLRPHDMIRTISFSVTLALLLLSYRQQQPDEDTFDRYAAIMGGHASIMAQQHAIAYAQLTN